MTRNIFKRWQVVPVAFLAVAAFCVAQNFRRPVNGDIYVEPERVIPSMSAREAQESLGGTTTPNWTNPPAFKKDVFTFARVVYSVDGRHGDSHAAPNHVRWRIDWPNSDLNFSYRLQQMTCMKVDPDGKFVHLNDKELAEYPFIYFVEAGRMTLQDDEVVALRKYLLNGGFAMFDDFWGDPEYQNFYEEIKKVFPDREPQELPLSHPIFHGIFDLKEKPQVPGVSHAHEETPEVTWENTRTVRRDFRPAPSLHTPEELSEMMSNRRTFIDTKPVHYRAIFDDKGRIMVMICHNTDLGDGWEREGENHYYFEMFSEKKAYPLGINIIFYAMTH